MQEAAAFTLPEQAATLVVEDHNAAWPEVVDLKRAWTLRKDVSRCFFGTFQGSILVGGVERAGTWDGERMTARSTARTTAWEIVRDRFVALGNYGSCQDIGYAMH